MAVWTRTEDADYITYVRDDGLAGYKISKLHSHLHIEVWRPWAESPEHHGGSHAGSDQYVRDTILISGDTVAG